MKALEKCYKNMTLKLVEHAPLDSLTPKTIFLTPRSLRSDYYKHKSVEMLIRALATRASIVRRAMKHAALDSLTLKTIF